MKRTRTGKRLLAWALSLALVLGLLPGTMGTAYADNDPYASLKNTTTVVTFDGKPWYLIDYDSSTATLLSKDCVAASNFGSNNTYSGSDVEAAVNTYYSNSVSANAKAAVSGDKMFLLTTEQANAIIEQKVRICSQHSQATGTAWWLCSPVPNNVNAAVCVGCANGVVYTNGNNRTVINGVRPALKLNLASAGFSSVSLSGGANAEVSGGSTIQSFFDVGNPHSAITDVIYTAKPGCAFPEESDCYKTANGITVKRTSDTVITVSGTPAGVAEISVPDAVHVHSLTYSVDGAAITATCTAVGCTLDDGSAQQNHAVSLTIAAPALTAYGDAGSADAILSGLDDFNAATGKALSAADVKYYKAKNGGTYTRGDAVDAAPTNAGDYMAEITLASVKTGEGDNQSVTASVGYSIAKVDPVAAAPTDVTATYGQTLADVTLTNPTDNTPGTWAWADSATDVGNVGSHTFKANFTPTDVTNYNAKADVDVTVKVGREKAVPATVTANNRKYDGTQKLLVNVDNSTLEGGKMQYAYGADATTAPAAKKYSTYVPTATEAGTYYVWYKAKGDENHADSEAKAVEVTITAEQKTEPEPEPEKVTSTKNFRTLRLKAAKRDKGSVTLSWEKQDKADGYKVYGCVCKDDQEMELLKTIKDNKTTSWTWKKLKKGTHYKFRIVAYKKVNGKEQELFKSMAAHTVTKGGKHTVSKAVKVNKTSVSLKEKETFQIKASEVKDEKKKKVDQHRAICYESSNEKVVKVNDKGKVTAKKKGKANVFVYAETGNYQKIQFTVK